MFIILNSIMGSFKLLALLALSTSALSADINTPPIGTPTPATTAATPTDVSYPTITLAPDVVAVGDSTILIIDSTTLTPGPDLHTIGIHTISFGSSGSFAIDGSTSNFLSLETPTQPDTVNPPSNTPTFTPEVPDSSTPSSIESTEDPTPSSGPSTTTEDVISQETPTVIDTPTTTLVDPSTPTETLQTPTTTQGDPTPDTSAPVTTEISEPPATPSGPVSTPTDQTTFTTTGTPGANPITSTMTEPPPEFSTEGITSEGLTTNTWITTTKDGDTTVVPVIVGCPGCGGALGGIILWNLPPIPNVVFKFPSFPNLPSFYLPCIRILGVSVGQCTQGPSEPPEDGDDSKPSTTKEDKTTTEEQTTTTATSCGEVETVTDIVVACSTGLFSGTATTDCYSTSTEIVTGCSVTASVETIYTGGFCAMRPSAAARGPVEVYSFEGYVPFTLPDITDDVSGTPVSTPNDPQDTPSSTANDPQDTPSTTAPTTTFPSTPTSFTTSVIRTPTTSTEDPDTTPTNTPSTVESPSIPSTPTTEDTSAATPTTTEDTSAATPTTPASTTTLPPRVPAPDITINAPDATPECSQGYATYTMSAVASAPANAESLKFIIPQADERENKDWRFDLSPGFLVDPKTNVKSWEVGTSDGGDPIASGDGGEDMEITWLSPKDASKWKLDDSFHATILTHVLCIRWHLCQVDIYG